MNITLFDKIIKVALVHEGTGAKDPVYSIILDATKGGIKPKIHFSYNAVPGQVVYKVVLRVTNLMLPADVYMDELSTMYITAGYKDGESITIVSPIFLSYVESPGPDSVTVFEGVASGSISTISPVYQTTRIKIELKGDKFIVKDFIESVISQIGETKDSIQASIISEDDPFFTSEISIKKIDKTFNSVNEVLIWVHQILTAHGNTFDPPVPVYTILNNGVFKCTTPRSTKSTIKIKEVIPVIDYVESVSFMAQVLHLSAPWIPSLIPGGHFRMSPNFFKVQGLANSFRDLLNEGNENTYQVINMSIDFSTEGENNMTIMAVQISDSQKDVEELKQHSESLSSIKEVDNVKMIVVEGTTKETPQPLKDNTGLDIWSSSNQLLSSGGITFSINDEEYKKHWRTFSDLAEQVYKDFEWKKPEKYEKRDWGIPGHKFITGAYLWPLIVVGTYAQHKANEGPNNIYQEIKPDGTFRLLLEYNLFAPTINSPDDLYNNPIYKNIFDYFAKRAQELCNNGDTTWKNYAQVFGKIVEALEVGK